MASVKEAYETKYGIVYRYILECLGGDYAELINRVQHNYDNPDEMLIKLLRASTDLESYADAAHGLIVSEIRRLYFQQINRPTALAICNTLSMGGGDGTIRIRGDLANPDLEFNSYSFQSCWNQQHPDEEPIVRNMDYL